jgi:hypothetical protein
MRIAILEIIVAVRRVSDYLESFLVIDDPR